MILYFNIMSEEFHNLEMITLSILKDGMIV